MKAIYCGYLEELPLLNDGDELEVLQVLGHGSVYDRSVMIGDWFLVADRDGDCYLIPGSRLQFDELFWKHNPMPARA